MIDFDALFYTDVAQQQSSVPVFCLAADDLPEFSQGLSAVEQSWLSQLSFDASAGTVCLIPSSDGQSLSKVLFGYDVRSSEAQLGKLYHKLPNGDYELKPMLSVSLNMATALYQLAVAAYRFTSKIADSTDSHHVRWYSTSDVDHQALKVAVQAMSMARDLVNTPPNHLLSEDLAKHIEALANQFSATFSSHRGEALLSAGYEATHAVGRAGEQLPCMTEFTWGDEAHPKLTLVGKGVIFDSGGLSIKPSKSMETMKKDMGGAAHVIALAYMIMSHALPVHLRVIIPCVENAIGQSCYRVGDVLTYNDGSTVEVTNTDAEGRLILADALLMACRDEQPDLLIDFATLTGAARVAVGNDVGAYFTDDDALAQSLQVQSHALADPLWRLPLYLPYLQAMDSQIADLKNAASTGYGGATTAALFLQHFVPEAVTWLHFDVSAWSDHSRTGQQIGGAVQGLRAMYAVIAQRFA